MCQNKSICVDTTRQGATHIPRAGRLQPSKGLSKLLAALSVVLITAAHANGNQSGSGLPARVLASAPGATPSPAPALALTTTPALKGGFSNGLTIEALANAQRQKLAAQLQASKPPIDTKSQALAPSAAKHAQRQRAGDPFEGLPTQSLVVMATYGTVANPKAEVQWNGATQVVSPRTALGTATVEAISHGQVNLNVVHQQKPRKYTLQPGDRVEWRP